jgi:hypothetical protein
MQIRHLERTVWLSHQHLNSQPLNSVCSFVTEVMSTFVLDLNYLFISLPKPKHRYAIGRHPNGRISRYTTEYDHQSTRMDDHESTNESLRFLVKGGYGMFEGVSQDGLEC